MCNIKLLFTFLIIIALDYTVRVQGFRKVVDKKGRDIVLAVPGEKVDLECKTNVGLAYCGLHHPSGKRFSVASETLKGGICSLKLTLNKTDYGLWICHMGTHVTGLEKVKPFEVRIVDKVAAIWKNVSIEHKSVGIIECMTVRTMRPIRYCRFEPPNGPAFSINADINNYNAIQGKYFYPRNKSLDRGDCAVNIMHASEEDTGVWTCGASLEDGQEYTDTIYVKVGGFYKMTTASMAPFLLGVLAVMMVVIILGGLVWWRQLCVKIRPNEEGDIHEMQALPGPLRSLSLPRLVVESPTEPSSSVSQGSD